MSKSKFLKGFGTVVIVLALVRCIFPSIASQRGEDGSDALATSKAIVNDEPADTLAETDADKPAETKLSLGRDDQKTKVQNRHPIMGVYCYSEAFPDSNDVQLETAKRLGVKEVGDRLEAEERKGELVYMAASPYYHVDRLKSSIPYLIPKAAILLNDMGRHFFDSLYVKGIPLHKFIVSSVLRTEEDVRKLQTHNENAESNSCHKFGTTIDICYNRYHTISPPDGPQRRTVRDDTLKWVLSEVLRDAREEGRCYVKYEVKQGCFHITVR